MHPQRKLRPSLSCFTGREIEEERHGLGDIVILSAETVTYRPINRFSATIFIYLFWTCIQRKTGKKKKKRKKMRQRAGDANRFGMNIRSRKEDLTVDPVLWWLEMIASSVSMGDRGSLNRLEVREDLMRGIYNISRERKGTEEDNPEGETKIREPH